MYRIRKTSSLLVCLMWSTVLGLTAEIGASDNRTQSLLMPVSVFSVANCVSNLRAQGCLLHYERRCDDQVGGLGNSALETQIVTQARIGSLLDLVCQEKNAYSWSYNNSENSYCVFPATNALSEIRMLPVAFSNQPLSSIFMDPTVSRYMRANGLLMMITKSQRRIWSDIRLDVDFQGGTFGEFLNHVSSRLGNNICWDINPKLIPGTRAIVHGKVMECPTFRLEFLDSTGSRINSLPETIRNADTSVLKGMLENTCGADKSDVAFEIAARFWASGNKIKAQEFFHVALSAADTEAKRWDVKLRMLRKGAGYPTADDASSPRIKQYKAFLRDSNDMRTRHQALSALLDAYLSAGMASKAKALIENASKNERDRAWIRHAAYTYRKKSQNKPLALMPFDDGKSLENEPQYTRTTYTISKTSDGELKVKKTVEKE